MLADRTDVGGHDDVHEGDLLILHALGGDVTSQLFVIHLVLQKNLRVAAHGHQVRRNTDNGINIADAPTVRTITEHEILPFMGRVRGNKNECK